MVWKMDDERGAAMLETAILLLLMIMLSAGVLDVGKGFYQYNLTASAARFGARWASVVGGTCSDPTGSSTSDWCNQLNNASGGFWAQPGNVPLQSGGTSCPTHYDSTFTGYYTVGDYLQTTATSIVGAIAQHFDTTPTSAGVIKGALMPGLDLSHLKVCLQLTWNSSTSSWSAQPGDKVAVYVYYPFFPMTPLISALREVDFTATSEYRID
jgi:hypothetical protein